MMMFWCLALFAVAFAKTTTTTKDEKLAVKHDEKLATPDEVADAEHTIMDVWLVVPREPEGELKPSWKQGAPWMKFKPCAEEADCGEAFTCQSMIEGEQSGEHEEGQKWCQIKEEYIKWVACPAGLVSIANKWCKSDSDCKSGSCNMVPASDPAKWAKKEDETFLDVGVCCCDTLAHPEVYPEAVNKCPTAMKLLRSAPCGLAALECPGESHCFAELDGDKYGRCCLAEADSDIKTDSSFHSHYGRYRHHHRYHHHHHHGHHGHRYHRYGYGRYY